ncbi:MAG: hypothetical protein KatS3mg113_1097 [Planctomycetaceae bacterium]|nr:MAG: hypothetical protein KatS3mg113_1097 [Planctomycetaceae bacterium]
MTPRDTQRMIRQLAAVEGYLELSLPQAALEILERLEIHGPLAAVALLFKGEALQALGRLDEAIEALQRAVELFPGPYKQRALWSLSRCYAQLGATSQAEQALAALKQIGAAQGGGVHVVLMPIFQIEHVPGRSRRTSEDKAGR